MATIAEDLLAGQDGNCWLAWFVPRSANDCGPPDRFRCAGKSWRRYGPTSTFGGGDQCRYRPSRRPPPGVSGAADAVTGVLDSAASEASAAASSATAFARSARTLATRLRLANSACSMREPSVSRRACQKVVVKVPAKKGAPQEGSREEAPARRSPARREDRQRAPAKKAPAKTAAKEPPSDNGWRCRPTPAVVESGAVEVVDYEEASVGPAPRTPSQGEAIVSDEIGDPRVASAVSRPVTQQTSAVGKRGEVFRDVLGRLNSALADGTAPGGFRNGSMSCWSQGAGALPRPGKGS